VPLLKGGWSKTAVVLAAVLESSLFMQLPVGWAAHLLLFALFHLLGGTLYQWHKLQGVWQLSPVAPPQGLSGWARHLGHLLLLGSLGAVFHAWGPGLLVPGATQLLAGLAPGLTTLALPGLGLALPLASTLGTLVAVSLHALYNLLTPGVVAMAGPPWAVGRADSSNAAEQHLEQFVRHVQEAFSDVDFLRRNRLVGFEHDARPWSHLVRGPLDRSAESGRQFFLHLHLLTKTIQVIKERLLFAVSGGSRGSDIEDGMVKGAFEAVLPETPFGRSLWHAGYQDQRLDWRILGRWGQLDLVATRPAPRRETFLTEVLQNGPT